MKFFSSGSAPATAGFSLKPLSLAKYNLEPLNDSEIAVLTDPNVSNKVKTILSARAQGGAPVQLDGSGNPVAAWVRLEITDADNQLFTKGAAYAGCPGGWRWAGHKHLDMHMAARVTRDESNGELERTRAFHIERQEIADAVAAGMPDVDTVDVRGPGIVGYSGKADAPVGESNKLTLVRSPNSFVSWLVVGGAGAEFYKESEALLSCKDLAQRAPNTPAGVPCIDESQVVPSSTYIWALKQVGTGKVVKAFPHEVGAVPLSKAFVQANADQLFAKISSITPASITAINAAISAASSQSLEDVFSLSYTLGSAYGATVDHCGLNLRDAKSSVLLNAEVNAVGQATKCSFTSSKLNSGSLAKPSAAVGMGDARVVTQVLGNQMVTRRNLPQ